ncbi:hypothetical protein ACTXT7_017405, partial [Hymenolepis weldensis]
AFLALLAQLVLLAHLALLVWLVLPVRLVLLAYLALWVLLVLPCIFQYILLFLDTIPVRFPRSFA